MGLQSQLKENGNNNRIINLSSLILNSGEKSLLNKGLKYTPTPHFDNFTRIKDINMFARKLALHKYFKKDQRRIEQNQDDDVLEMLEELQEEGEGEINVISPPLSHLKPMSKMTPPFVQYKHLDVFVNMVTEDIKKIKPRGGRKHTNLSKEDKQALGKLKENEDIILKPSDKGGNIVIQNKEDYKAMVMKLLSDKDTYQIMPNDPTKTFLRELETILREAKIKKLITEDEYRVLYNPNPTIPTILCAS